MKPKIKTQEEFESYVEEREQKEIAAAAEVAGLKTELLAAKAGLETITKTMQELSSKVVAGSRFDVPKDTRTSVKEAFRAIRKGNIAKLYEAGGKFITAAENEQGDWRGQDWNVFSKDFQGDEKTILGSYYLRGDATTGSYLVPVEYAREILQIPTQETVMLSRITNYPVGARTNYIPVSATKPTISWPTDETTAKTEGVLTFAQKTLSIKTAAVWCSVTDELLEDSVADLPGFIRDQFQQAWGAEIDKQVLVASTAPFVGMTKDTGVTSVVMQGITDFGGVTFQYLLDMENGISLAKGEAALQGAIFIMHRKTFNTLRAKKDDMGNPIYQKPAEGVPATIYNHPYLLSDQMPYASAPNTGFIVLGNPRYWAYGARTAIAGDFRVFGDTVYAMQHDQVFFRLRARAGFVGAQPAAIGVLKTGS